MADQKRPTLSVNVPDVAVPEKPPADPALSAHGASVSKEEFDELRAHNEDLAAQNALLHTQFNELMEQVKALKKPAVNAAAAPDEEANEATGEPVFDEDAPYGIVTGDHEAGFVQGGHQFTRDKRYLATEKHHGVPRRFNAQLVGVVRPRKPAELQ